MLLEPWAATRPWPAPKGLNSKLHLAVDAHGMPVRMILTAGTAADCTQGRALIEGFTAECLLADKGYDTKLCWA